MSCISGLADPHSQFGEMVTTRKGLKTSTLQRVSKPRLRDSLLFLFFIYIYIYFLFYGSLGCVETTGVAFHQSVSVLTPDSMPYVLSLLILYCSLKDFPPGTPVSLDIFGVCCS